MIVTFHFGEEADFWTETLKKIFLEVAIKEKLLNVKKATLEQNGAVSAECALEMVEGCCNNLNATASIAVTGIAGPYGGVSEKPVGLVFIAVKVKNKIAVTSYNIKGIVVPIFWTVIENK